MSETPYGVPEPYPPPPIESQYGQSPKRSGFGIASFILGLIAGMSVLGFCAASYRLGYGATASTPSQPDVLTLTCCGIGLLASVVGIALGIVGVVQKNVNKVFGILGLVLSSATLLLYAGLTLLGVVIVIMARGGSF